MAKGRSQSGGRRTGKGAFQGSKSTLKKVVRNLKKNAGTSANKRAPRTPTTFVDDGRDF